MKRLLSLLVVIIMALSLGTAACASEVTYNGTVYIGLVCSLTGSAPAQGERTQQTVRLAVDEVNARGGVQGMKVEIVMYDDAGETGGALNSVNKLAADDRIVGIIGPQASSNVIACSDTLLENTLPCLTGGTSVLIWNCENPYIFRFRTADSTVASGVMEFLVAQKGVKNVGIIYASNDFGTGGMNIGKKWLEDHGMTAAAIESINVGDKDFTATLLKMKNANVDGFFVWADAAEDAILVRQYNELGLTSIPMAGSGSFSNATFYDLLETEYSDGLYVATDFSPDNTDAYVQEFCGKFEAAYGIKPDQFAGFYWDAAQVMLDALARTSEFTRESLREAILATDIVGNSGHLYSLSGGLHPNDLGHQVLICINENKTPKVIGVVTE